MRVETESSDDGIALIKLAGRMDAQGAPEIEQKVMDQAASHRSIIMDMAAVDFLASVGIRTLLLVAKAVSKRGGRMVLLNPDPSIAKILEISGIDSLIPTHRSLDEARRAASL